MKTKCRLVPLNLITPSVVMAVFCPLNSFAADFTWKGTTNSTWATGTNWLAGTAPTYGTDYSADRLVIGNGANAGMVYDPGAGVTTTFGSGRGIIIGSTTQGPANLTVTSGTLKINGPGTVGNEPIMANGVSANVLINGGNLDLTGHLNTFRFFGSASTGLTSTLTISSGSFSSNGFNFLSAGTAGTGTVNLDGGSMAVTAFTRTVTTASTILNLNGGILRIRGADSANFLPALGGLQTIVKTGGAIIDSNSLNLTIAEVLEHDTTLGAGLDGGLTKNSAGTLTLSGANTYNGATSITAGTVSAATIVVSGVSSNLGNATSAVTLGSAGAEGTLSYTGASATYTRGFTIGGAGGGRLDVTTAANTLTVNTGAITGTGLLTLGGSGGKIINAAITHSGGLTKAASSGSVFLNNSANSYTGVTDITGALIVSANNALGTTAGGTTVNANSALGLSGGIDYSALETVSGSGVGTGALAGVTPALSRGFIQSTSGNNTFRGNIIVNAGGVSRIGTQNGASLTLTGTITQASGTMYFRPGDTGGEYITLSNSGNSFGGNSVIYTNNASTNYSGVRLGVTDALPTSLTITGETGTAAGTALNLNGFNQRLNGLAGSQVLNIINSNTSTASTLTVDNLLDRSTTGTLIRGGGGLGTINVVKDGNFTQTLSGTHDYTGTTAVNDGTLVVNGNISTSVVTVAGGATLGGSGTLGGNTTISGNHSPGNSPGIQTFGANLSYNTGATVAWELAADALVTRGTEFDGINVGGVLDFTGTTTINLAFNGLGSTVDWTDTLWDTSHTGTSGWLIYDVSGSTTNFGNLSINTIDWLDGSSQSFDSLLSGNTFSLYKDGNDIYLNYNVVPEPRAALLGGLGLLAFLRRRR